MKIYLFGVILVVSLASTWAQVPKRLQIPGAIPIGSVGIDRPLPLRRQHQHQQPQYQAAPAPVRLRRPIPNAIPAPLPQIRPVVEEPDDLPQSSINLNEEAARLSSIPLPGPPRQQLIEDDDDDEPPQPKYIQPVQFRPERPPIQVAQPVRAPPQPIRQTQPVRQAPIRQTSQPARRPQPQYAEEDNVPRQDRRRKPEVKILRKYREDNPDGSITWGFENDDGTFKEETIGIDCITRGKYGYIDPDGNRREYTYETGLKCDEPELEEEPLLQPAPVKNYKRPPPQPIRLQ